MKDLFSEIESGLRAIHYPKSPANLYDPIAYILSLGGKRLRPYLLMLVAEGYGAKRELAINPALAIEIFHNFTLVHDDIMDNAPLRRGNETVHEKWDENVAVLSGDTMMVKAYQHVIKNVPAEMLHEVLEVFNTTSIKVCEGQQMDMDFEELDKVSIDSYIHMIRYKTAELLGGAMRIGAILGEASEEQKDSVYQFAIEVGLAFQLMDDLLDVYADQAKFGKQVGGDIIENKKTYLYLQLEKKISLEDNAAWDKLKVEPDNDKKVDGVKFLYNKYGVDADTKKLIQEYYTKGLTTLEGLTVRDSYKSELKKFADQLQSREN
jgi:geranylgeranyl diphosphate synthase, type II